MSLSGFRLLVVIGKGGVGRSTTSAALALHAAASGQRVLVVDAVAAGGAALALGVPRPAPIGEMVDIESGPMGGNAGSRLALLELGTEAALDEYVRLNLRVPIAPRSLGPIARMFDYVATAAPAVREILTIGKIGHEVRREAWDLVVVDAPATGHVVELLSAPNALGELVGFGPLASESAWLSEMLAERDRTAAIAVTLAEELPVSETLELLERLELETDVGLAGVIVNRRPAAVGGEGLEEARILAEGGGTLGALAAIAADRHLVAERELARIEALGHPIIMVEERLDDPTAAVRFSLEQAGW